MPPSPIRPLTILGITDLPFWHADRGDRVRIAAFWRHLAGRYRMEVGYLGALEPLDRSLLTQRHPGLKVHALPTVSVWERLVRRLGRGYRAGDGAPEPDLASFRSGAAAAAVRALCRRCRPDIVLVEYIRLAYLAPLARRAAPTGCRWVIDTLDVMSDRYRQFQAAGERHWVRLDADAERRALEPFDAVLGIQDEDAARFRTMVPGKSVLTVGHAAPVAAHAFREAGDLRVLFVGSGGAPNRLALRTFVERVWPAAAAGAGRPATLTVVGDAGRALGDAGAIPGVTLAGRLTDLEACYAETDIVVNPVTFGGGLKIKNVEALCHGKPLITTAVGAQGLRDGAGGAFLVADGEAAQTTALHELLTDGARRRTLAHEARAYAQRRFSPSAAYGSLDQWMERRG